MNLPNKLTVLRMCMVPVFLFLLCVPLPIPDMWLRIITAAIFILTSLTDMIDGKIARHFNMISTLGKILDPLADKITQFTLIVCLAMRHPVLWSIIGLFVAKELFQFAFGKDYSPFFWMMAVDSA